jgi:hypothetical protein
VPRVVAKTELQTRFVINITLPGGFQMKSEVKPETQAKETRKTISEELFLKELQKVAPEAADLASWALANANQHKLQIDWGSAGPSLKYLDEGSGAYFDFT